MTIVVTGGSGFVGTALTKTLLAKGHTVIVIDKTGPALTHKDLFFIPCDLTECTMPFNVLERTDAVIHLAGSSVISTRQVVNSLEQTTNRPPIFIAASNVGYYGPGFERLLDERSAAGTTETARMIEDNETEAARAEQFGCRVVLIRTAPVIGKGGFIAPLLRMAKFHLTVRMTKEAFWMPWIHINDLIRIYLFALETNTLQGPVNAVAPTTNTSTDFFTAFRTTTRSIAVPQIPFLHWPRRDKITTLAISQKVVPQRLIDKGFEFAYTNITEAIADVVHTHEA